jgi:hypothetical protein
MIDDATSRLTARFVRQDSTAENMQLLWSYVEKNGRPVAFYTDKASLFQTAQKHKRDEPGVEKDAVEMPPTQIERALRELGIVWIAAHSPQAKGRVERNFGTAQDRLVKGMRVAGVTTLEEAKAYLETEYLPWWNKTLAVTAAGADDAHRPLDKTVNLAGVLSHVVTPGLRKADVRVEQRLDGSLAVRYQERYLTIEKCPQPAKVEKPTVPSKQPRKPARRGSDWNKNFDLKKAPPLWQAAQSAGYRQETE